MTRRAARATAAVAGRVRARRPRRRPGRGGRRAAAASRWSPPAPLPSPHRSRRCPPASTTSPSPRSTPCTSSRATATAARCSTTTETLVAVFPEFDQNRGIRRAIPIDYDGHPTDIDVESVTDATGAPRAFEVEADEAGEFLLVTDRAPTTSCTASRRYVIRYRQHNVTLEPDDAAIDEFYWDVNGTGWAPAVRPRCAPSCGCQRRRRGAASRATSPAIAAASGSSTPCESLATIDAARPWSSPRRSALGRTRTSSSRSASTRRHLRAARRVVRGIARGDRRRRGRGRSPCSAMLAAIVLRVLRWRNHPGRGTIIAQYEPPAGRQRAWRPPTSSGTPARASRRRSSSGPSPASCASSRPGARSTPSSSSAGSSAIATPQSVVLALFSGNPRARAPDASSSRATPRSAGGCSRCANRSRKRVVQSGLRRRPDLGVARAARRRRDRRGVPQRDLRHHRARRPARRPVAVRAASSSAIVAAIVTLVAVADVRPLTEQGRAARDHLEGLRLYIRLAEADRLRVLQSPSGALRVDRPAAAPSPLQRPRSAGAPVAHDVARPGHGAEAQRATAALRGAVRPRTRMERGARRPLRARGRHAGLVLRARAASTPGASRSACRRSRRRRARRGRVRARARRRAAPAAAVRRAAAAAAAVAAASDRRAVAPSRRRCAHAGIRLRHSSARGRALVAQVDAALGVDAGRLVDEAVVERAVVVVAAPRRARRTRCPARP